MKGNLVIVRFYDQYIDPTFCENRLICEINMIISMLPRTGDTWNFKQFKTDKTKYINKDGYDVGGISYFYDLFEKKTTYVTIWLTPIITSYDSPQYRYLCSDDSLENESIVTKFCNFIKGIFT